jgi:hypothetical protein
MSNVKPEWLGNLETQLEQNPKFVGKLEPGG